MASKNAEVLRRVEIFENVGEENLEKIGQMLKERRLSEGQMLFKQGDVGDSLIIVSDGRIRVFLQEGNAEKVLAFFSEGQVLGEMSLLTGEPRSASAVAVSDSRVLTLSKGDFDSYLSSDVGVMREMMRLIALRQAQTNVRLTRQRDTEVEATSTRRGKVYTVFSPRGGAGKTTVAVNLAVSFAQRHPDQTALLDLSLTFGHCALVLNLVPKASLATITPDSLARLDREGLEYYLVRHASTLKILVGSTRPEEGETVTGDHVKSAIDLLARQNSVTIIDTAGNFGESTIAAIEAADKVILVCTPELTTLRDVRECQRIFLDLIQVPKEKVFYVMNQLSSSKVLGVEQFEQALEQEMQVELPYGSDVPAKAAVRGEAFTQSQPGAQIAKAIERIAVMLEEEASPKAQQAERRGLFQRR